MGSFFKSFFAALLALIIFTLLVFLLMTMIVGGITSRKEPGLKARSVLVMDLGNIYTDQQQKDPLALIASDPERTTPGLYDIIRLLRKAKSDKHIEGIYLQAGPNANGFAASAEIRNALADFRESGKFIIAHTDVLTQRSYAVASIADRIYVSPQGSVQWLGYYAEYIFLKGTLEKLDVEPQIFYAGKFKSATEPFRTDRMTPENKLQTTAWLNELYTDLLIRTAETRKLDTAMLHRLSTEALVRTPQDAVDYKLIDGLKYDDEVKDEIKAKLDVGKYERINFISINSYMATGKYKRTGDDKIALIYAQGNIVDGKGNYGSIGGETYRALIRKARLDKSIKAIVLRVNSGGGSAMASENIWREVHLAKAEKPVIVSFGDVAASGGYYIACGADSIFAQPNTITGSIGVFGIIPNLENFFKNKLGITFDGVKTGPNADMRTVFRPMNEKEKAMIQAEIESVYTLFKKRVAEGRKKDTSYVEEIAQGRIWTGEAALRIGLVDRLGGVEEAIASAARKAGLSSYLVKEYPEPQSIIEQILGKSEMPMSYRSQLRDELGDENLRVLDELKKVREMTNSMQARLPFEITIR